MMTANIIRVLALGIVQNDQGALLVDAGYDNIKKQSFYRLLGGGIEFGETGAEALEREFIEELGLEVTPSPLLSTAENIFTFEGQLGHQIILLYKCTFKNSAAYQKETHPHLDVPNKHAVWRTVEQICAEGAKLYPEGVPSLL